MASPQEFYASFQAARADIASRLDASDNLTTEQMVQLSQDIQLERKKLNDATSFLPAYDRRSCESQLQELEVRVDALRNRNAPAKGKFAFKKRAPAPASAPAPVPASIQQLSPASSSNSTSEPSKAIPTSNLQLQSASYKAFSLSSLSDQPTSSSDLTISALDHCFVDLLPQSPFSDTTDGPNLTAVHIRDIKNSAIILEHVRGSILAHNLERCVIVAACHQLRVHTSTNTRFHLHVSSNAVIEDCSTLTFAPYPSSLPLPASVRELESTHDAIQDFSHVKATPSPHWTSIPDSVPGNTEINGDSKDTNASAWWSEMRSLGYDSQGVVDQKDQEVHLAPVLQKILLGTQ